jgi:hypothetical protein
MLSAGQIPAPSRRNPESSGQPEADDRPPVKAISFARGENKNASPVTRLSSGHQVFHDQVRDGRGRLTSPFQ